MGQASCSLCEKPGDDVPAEKEVEDRVAQIREIVALEGEQPQVGLAKNYRRLSTSGPALSEGGKPEEIQKGYNRSSSLDARERIVNCTSSTSSLQKSGLEKVFNSITGDRRAVLISSLTESVANKRTSFKEKSEEVLCPPGRDSDELTLLAWMQELGIGWACKKGLKVNSPNQDSFSILAVESEFILIGVYDGHGPHGHDVSQFVRQEMVKLIMKNPNRTKDIESVLKDSFRQVQEATAKTSGLDAWESGTTCTMAYLDLVEMKATFAHVGDARSVMGARAKAGQDFTSEDMTVDHKPNLPEERKRIESATPPGRVLFDGFVNYRVFVQNGMYPGLNMSRALGDVWAHRDAGLSAVPDVRTLDLKPFLSKNAEVNLLVCTDGVWEFIDGTEAFKLTSQMTDPDMIVNRLAVRSWELWMEDSNNEICDDITAVCIQLHKVEQSNNKRR